MWAESGRRLPDCLRAEFEACQKCGRLEDDLLRVHRGQCHAENLVALSDKDPGRDPAGLPVPRTRHQASTRRHPCVLSSEPQDSSVER